MANNTTNPYNDTYWVDYYGADYPVGVLISKMEEGEIIIPTFQRGYVWKQEQASRFIESILLGFPTPNIFLTKDKMLGRMLVVDGQQRLKTLLFFKAGYFEGNKKFKLTNVRADLLGKTYSDLSINQQRDINNTILHTVIIKDNSPEYNSDAIFEIFERLNTGGTILEAQEIRAGIFDGAFMQLIRQLADSETWKDFFSKNTSKNQELILRFFALFFYLEESNSFRNMNSFLNEYASKNRNFELNSEKELKDIFEKTFSCLKTAITNIEPTLKKELFKSVQVFDAVCVSIAIHLQHKKTISSEAIIQLIQQVVSNSTDIMNAFEIKAKVQKSIQIVSDILNSL